RAIPSMVGRDLARVVTTKDQYEWSKPPVEIISPVETRHAASRLAEVESLASAASQPPPKFHVVAYDYGIKHNILRMLAGECCRCSACNTTRKPAPARMTRIICSRIL